MASIHPWRTDDRCADIKAEGTCKGLPYNSELISINGVSIHFWTGDLASDELHKAVDAASEAICRQRDVVSISHGPGKPAGFWTHQDIG